MAADMCGTGGMGPEGHRHCWQPGNVRLVRFHCCHRPADLGKALCKSCMSSCGFGGICFGSGLPPLNLPVTCSCKETSTLCAILYWDPNNVPKQLCPTP